MSKEKTETKVENPMDGKIAFKARARLMILLGEQLITDEVAAVSELVKNSYDADATEVEVELTDVSKKEEGKVVIFDHGHGMTKDQILKSWLELGAVSKHRKEGKPARVSEKLKRLYLGEKGLGRLAVHKIGKKTEIITKREGETKETKLVLDWTLFYDEEKFLEDVEMSWEEREPITFTKNSEKGWEHGTKITISKLQRNWTADRIKRVKGFAWSIQSPFAPIKDFKLTLKIDDDEDPETETMDTKEILETAHYFFEANIDNDGFATMEYEFKSPVYLKNQRKKSWTEEKKKDLKVKDHFHEGRNPKCGPFKITIYCWELDPAHRRHTFGKTNAFSRIIKPQTGMKVLRDKFRVFPYGNEDNDWLGMDQKRISQFHFNVSRNQIMGFAEISSKENPKLIDKSDREGLIDNEEFRDFKFLLLSSLAVFQAERNVDRSKTKQSQRLDPRLNKIATQLKRINTVLKKEGVSVEGRQEITKMVDNTRKIFEKTLENVETPLLGAASIGLTYLLPTHELKRNVRETVKILKKSLKDDGKNFVEDARKAIEQLDEATKIIRGIIRVQEKTETKESLSITLPIQNSIDLLERKLRRNNFETEIVDKLKEKINVDRQSIIIMLLNIIDNSIYWVSDSRTKDRKIKFIIDEIDGRKSIIISDNGPGFEDDLEVSINPFHTRKVDGLGLGLFICSRIADKNNYEMRILGENEIPGMLEGGNIAIIFPKEK